MLGVCWFVMSVGPFSLVRMTCASVLTIWIEIMFGGRRCSSCRQWLSSTNSSDCCVRCTRTRLLIHNKRRSQASGEIDLSHEEDSTTEKKRRLNASSSDGASVAVGSIRDSYVSDKSMSEIASIDPSVGSARDGLARVASGLDGSSVEGLSGIESGTLIAHCAQAQKLVTEIGDTHILGCAW